MPDCGGLNEWGCDGSGAPKDVRTNLFCDFWCISLALVHLSEFEYIFLFQIGPVFNKDSTKLCLASAFNLEYGYYFFLQLSDNYFNSS